MASLKVIGLQKVHTQLLALFGMMQTTIPPALARIGKNAKSAARQQVLRDTGALASSIKYEEVQKGPATYQINVTAGDPSIIRGAGRFTMSTRTGSRVTFKEPTTEYAVKQDFYGAIRSGEGKGYMSTVAMGKIETQAERMIAQAVNKAIRLI